MRGFLQLEAIRIKLIFNAHTHARGSVSLIRVNMVILGADPEADYKQHYNLPSNHL